MEEAKKTGGTGPASASVSAAASPVPPAVGTGASGPPKRRLRLPGEPEKSPFPVKARLRKGADGQRFEAIKALTNLADDGRFLLLYEMEGKTEAVNCWN